MEKTKEWVIVSYGLLIFFGLVGLVGGVWGKDPLATGVSIVALLGVGYFAVRKGQKTGL